MLSRYILSAAAIFGLAAAQTTSDCNPLNETDCKPNPAFGTSYLWHFNSTPTSDHWDNHVGRVIYDEENGATFTVAKQGDSPTLRTAFYFFFGRTELIMKAAPGIGIISSMMWLSDDLDEVDWEILGANDTHASTNYYGKGVEDFTKAGWHFVKDGMQEDYHNYTTTWTTEELNWYIDGENVRKVIAKDDMDSYPQTPMRLSLGIWAAGDPTMPEGTRAWAGGGEFIDLKRFRIVLTGCRYRLQQGPLHHARQECVCRRRQQRKGVRLWRPVRQLGEHRYRQVS
jgi:beta-glucanase (GH16 family)